LAEGFHRHAKFINPLIVSTAAFTKERQFLLGFLNFLANRIYYGHHLVRPLTVCSTGIEQGRQFILSSLKAFANYFQGIIERVIMRAH